MTAPAVHDPRPYAVLRTGARKVAELLASPLVPEDYLDLLDPLRSGAALRARVLDVRPETAGAATLTLRVGRGWRGHRAGQYVRFGVDVDGVRRWRAYSLTSDARDGSRTVTVTTKAIPDGLVSNHLVHGGLRPGELVHLDQATGDFVLPDPLPERVLFVTAGSGVTPVAGMLRSHPALTDGTVDVVHVHIAPGASEVLFRAELRRYAAGRGRYSYVEHLDEEAGLLDLACDLDRFVPDWRDRQTWACGPTGLLDTAEELWAQDGSSAALHVERFRPSVLTPGEGGEITFLRSDVTVDADGSTPLLDAGEEAGVLMPSGCRMGICYGCVATLRQGAVRDLRTGEVTVAEDGAPLPIQTCINAVCGTADIEL